MTSKHLFLFFIINQANIVRGWWNRITIGIQPSTLNSGYQYFAQQSAVPWPDELRQLSVLMRVGFFLVGFVLMIVKSQDRLTPKPSCARPYDWISRNGLGSLCVFFLFLCACVSIYDLKVKALTLVFTLLFHLVSSSCFVFNCLILVFF